MVPLIPMELDGFVVWLRVSSRRNFANPKSPTWPTISSSRRTLPGLRSQ
jgi:hypothetical protein